MQKLAWGMLVVAQVVWFLFVTVVQELGRRTSR